MPKVTTNQDGSIDFLVHLTAEQVAILLYKHREINASIFDEIEAVSVGVAYKELQGKAMAFYRAKFDAGEVDGVLSALGKETDLVAWYMAHSETETVKQREDRLEREEQERQAQIEAAEQEEQEAAAALAG